MRKALLLVFILTVVNSCVFSQNGASVEPGKRKYQFIPSIGVGAGFSKFTGDIEDKTNTNVHWIGNKFTYEAAASINLSKSFYANVNTIMGNISGNENSHGQHRNFQSSLFNIGLNLEYSFGGLYKKKRPFVTPFLSAGFYYGRYSASTDLYDENGNLYYYWSDGKMRNVAENAPDADDADLLTRDYTFETKMADPVSAFSVPVGGGFDFHVGQRLVFRLSTKYFFSLSDKLDGFDTKPFSQKNDGYFNSSASIFFNLVPDKSNYLPKDVLRELDAEDYDGDGVPDITDECGGTPDGVSVNDQGCPIDVDTDGIPDYLDEEPNSPTTAVGTDGVVFDYLKIAQNAADSLGILHALLKKYPNHFLKSVNQKFTVYAGAFDQSSYAQKLFLQSIPGITETQVNDTLFVYSVGTYSKFDDAQQKTNELQMKGLDHAFEVPTDQLQQVASDLKTLMVDTIVSAEAQRKAQEKKVIDDAIAKGKNFSEGKNFKVITPAHSEEKTKSDGFATAVKEEKKTETVKPVEATKAEAVTASVNEEKKPEKEVNKPQTDQVLQQNAIASVNEEEKPEAGNAEKKETVTEAAVVAQPKPAEEKKSKDVVKFSLDVVEHSDKPLPFGVLLIMQRETLTTQTVRVMDAKIYSVGKYDTIAEVEKIKAEIAGHGVTETTVIGLINNIKVTQKEAEEMIKKTGQ